ncbi:MAG: glutamate--tRNA ligase, partial [Clostridiales bacterium]|nr:glutamate--tRNA ligase [Candidatus Coliplasma equi]
MSFFYDDLFEKEDKIPENFAENDIKAVFEGFKATYDEADEQNDWFAKIKAIAEQNGFCPDMKLYKANPENYKGSVADVSMFLRVAVTGRLNSPDLYEVMHILGKEKVFSRLSF